MRAVNETDLPLLYTLARSGVHSYFAIYETTGRFSLSEMISDQKMPGREELIALADDGAPLFLARTVSARPDDKVMAFQWRVLPDGVRQPELVRKAFRHYISAIFEKFNFIRMHTEILPWENEEKNLLKSFGFVFEGAFRDHLFLSGRYVSVEVWALLKEEYNPVFKE